VKLSADRLTAARLLMRVEEGAFSSRLLAGGGVAPAARVRVLETLRWLRALDAILKLRCRRNLMSLDPEVRAALRLGLVEVVRLGMPPALATDGAVRLTRRLGKASASGLVNAVLRKAAAEWSEALTRSTIDVQLSHPWWLFSRWVDSFGEEAAEKSMLAAQERAATWVWFFSDLEREELRRDGIVLDPHPWCPGAWSAPGDASRLVETVKAGGAYAQDPSSQLVAHVAAALAGEGDRMLDLCAAPGGKTALMMHLSRWRRVAAADLQPTRARLMRTTLERVGGCSVVAADARRPPFSAGGWDLVLLDAPCTGTGTFRRHPELKWRLRRQSVADLAAKQRQLLEAGLELVAPSGILLYATCSVEPEENEEVVRHLPAGFEHEDFGSVMPQGVPSIPTSATGVRILPNPDGDGFTMHAIRRVGSV
jgi:16S rRNA (cytosine967-C5)-methyltransferase